MVFQKSGFSPISGNARLEPKTAFPCVVSVRIDCCHGILVFALLTSPRKIDIIVAQSPEGNLQHYTHCQCLADQAEPKRISSANGGVIVLVMVFQMRRRRIRGLDLPFESAIRLERGCLESQEYSRDILVPRDPG